MKKGETGASCGSVEAEEGPDDSPGTEEWESAVVDASSVGGADESGDETEIANDGEGRGGVDRAWLGVEMTGDGASEREATLSEGVAGFVFGESPRLARYCEISGGNSTVLSATCFRRFDRGCKDEDELVGEVAEGAKVDA